MLRGRYPRSVLAGIYFAVVGLIGGCAGAKEVDDAVFDRAVLAVAEPMPDDGSSVTTICDRDDARPTAEVCSVFLRGGAQVPDATMLTWWYRVAGAAVGHSFPTERGGTVPIYGVWVARADGRGGLGWVCPGDEGLAPGDREAVSLSRDPWKPRGFKTIAEGLRGGCRLDARRPDME
jgi:hypothetical protein